MTKANLLFCIFVLAGVATASPRAFADCAGPNGEAGAVIYNADFKTVQFCDGLKWIGMTGSVSTNVDPRIGAVQDNKWCATNGSSVINCDQNAPAGTLSGLLDVNTAGVTGGKVLMYNILTSKWEPGTVAGGGGGGAAAGSGVGEVQVNYNGSLATVTNFQTNMANTSAISCPSTYVKAGSGCYRITGSLSWTAASSNCQGDGGSLAKIEDADENIAIYSLISVDSWIGGTQPSGWTWADGSALTYTNWAPGEPNNSGTCMVMYKSTAPGMWDDTTCTTAKPSVCEATPTTDAAPSITYVNMPAVGISETGSSVGDCSSAIDGVILRRAGALFICDFAYSGGWRKLQTSGTITVRNNAGYFVSTAGSYNGALGGLAGANAKCLAELKANSWRGKEDAEIRGMLVSSKVRAFLCNGSSCQNALPSKAYYFASANTGYGGSMFVSDASGLGPLDTAGWLSGSRFCGATDGYGSCSWPYQIWTGRSTGANNLWPNTSDGNNCSGWTSTAGNGRTGYMSFTTNQRWSYTNSACSGSYPLLCFVDP